MGARFLFVVVSIYCLSGLSGADKISNFIILDNEGMNTCIGDLHCFLRLHVLKTFTLSFDLTLDNSLENEIYKIVIEQVKEEDIFAKQLYLCYDEAKKSATLEESCLGTVVVPAGKHHIMTEVTIPEFKDVASMIISGPNGANGFRGVVSTISSHPPIQLCNPGSNIC